MQHDHAVEVACCQVQIVHGGNDGNPSHGIEFDDQVQDITLPRNIQLLGRFIEKQNF